MGPGCLTAVFGMGTGVSSRVCSPESRVRPRGGAAVEQEGSGKGWTLRALAWRDGGEACPVGVPAEQGINAAKRSAVSTGWLRVLLPLHARPIDLVVFQEPSYLRTGDLILRGVSRLDAFSVYPGRAWLPSAAPSGTTGTPEARPSQSSRTREGAAQASCARNR